MINILPVALNETLAYLMTLWRENVSPELAMARFRLLQKRHPNMEMDLVWEEESYSPTVHYDALLHLPAQGTVSLSFCPDRAVPWPLRGVQHWCESVVARVNGTSLQIEEAMACLDFLWGETRIIARLVNVCLIQEAIQKRALSVSDPELQQAMDVFRKRYALYTAADTHRWMEQHGMTHGALERHIAGEVAAAKLRDQIADGRVEEYFNRHPSAFDTARIGRFKVTDEESAYLIYQQIRGGMVDFFEAAQSRFLTGEDTACCDLFAVVRRKQIPPQQAEVLFAASPGEIVGPLQSGEGYDIVRVLQIDRARLDEPTREALKEMLFEEWLAERRREATIEWFWGKADGAQDNEQIDNGE